MTDSFSSLNFKKKWMTYPCSAQTITVEKVCYFAKFCVICNKRLTFCGLVKKKTHCTSMQDEKKQQKKNKRITNY